MNPISNFPSPASAASILPSSARPALGRGQKAAREFEAQLIESVLESLEKTFATVPGQEGMPGEDSYNYLGSQALASIVAAGGGFGMARMISPHLSAADRGSGNQGSGGRGSGDHVDTKVVTVTGYGREARPGLDH